MTTINTAAPSFTWTNVTPQIEQNPLGELWHDQGPERMDKFILPALPDGYRWRRVGRALTIEQRNHSKEECS